MLSSPPDQAKCHHHCDPGQPSARGGDDIYVNTPPVSHISVFIPIVPVMAGVTNWHSGPTEGVKCLNGANDGPMTLCRDPGANTWSHHQQSDEAIYSVLDQTARWEASLWHYQLYGHCVSVRCLVTHDTQFTSWQSEECLHCRDQEQDINIADHSLTFLGHWGPRELLTLRVNDILAVLIIPRLLTINCAQTVDTSLILTHDNLASYLVSAVDTQTWSQPH